MYQHNHNNSNIIYNINNTCNNTNINNQQSIPRYDSTVQNNPPVNFKLKSLTHTHKIDNLWAWNSAKYPYSKLFVD